MLDFGDWSNVVDLNEINKERAKRENINVVNNENIEVLEIDNHETHIAEHTAFVLSKNFDLTNKDLKNKILKHINEHKKYIVV